MRVGLFITSTICRCSSNSCMTSRVLSTLSKRSRLVGVDLAEDESPLREGVEGVVHRSELIPERRRGVNVLDKLEVARPVEVDETEVDARRKVRYVEVVVGPHFARPLAGIPAKGIPLKRVRRAQDQIEPAAIGGPPGTAGAHVVRDEGIVLQIFRSLALGSKPACASHRGRIG